MNINLMIKSLFMKKLILFLSLLLLATTFTHAATIRGKFIGKEDGNILVIIDGEKSNQKIENGEWSMQYEVTKPNTEVVIRYFAKESIVICLKDNNDQVEFEASKDENEHLRIKFQGDRKDLNYYLSNYDVMQLGEEWDMENIAKMSFKEFSAKVDALQKKYDTLLDKIKGEDKAFIFELRDKMHVEMLAKKQRYCWAVERFNKERMDKDADYVKFARSINVNDEERMKRDERGSMGGYMSLLNGYIRWEMAVNNDPRYHTNLQTAAFMEWTNKLIKNEAIANALMNKEYDTYFVTGGGEKSKDVYEAYIKYSTDTTRLAEVSAKFEAINKLAAGVMAPDFEMTGLDGKVYKLSDFRGKNLYIDVWATWCGPCVGEIPHFQKQYEKYKDCEALEFISISIDSNKKFWENLLNKAGSDWKQFIVENGKESDFCKKYMIDGIPRFILIDKEGKIISVSAPRPSSPEIEPLLEKYSKAEVKEVNKNGSQLKMIRLN